MPLSKQKKLLREEFLELLDDEDVKARWSKWELPPEAAMRKDSTAFLAAINLRSKTTLMQDVMGLRTATLQMLSDVLSFMSSQMSAVRTTASLIVLKDKEFDVAPQQVDAALKWSRRALRYSSATWRSLAERFESEVMPVLKKVERYGHVEFSFKPESTTNYLLRTDMGKQPSYRRNIPTARCDAQGLKVRQAYDRKIADLCQKVSKLDGSLSDAHAQSWLMRCNPRSGVVRHPGRWCPPLLC